MKQEEKKTHIHLVISGLYLIASGIFMLCALSIFIAAQFKGDFSNFLLTTAWFCLALTCIALAASYSYSIPRKKTAQKLSPDAIQCINCQTELTAKDISSNICHSCGKFAALHIKSIKVQSDN